MSWPNLRRCLPLISVLSTTAFLTGCGSDAALRLGIAESAKAEAGLVDQALEARTLPPLPPDCRRKETSGIRKGDRLDVAALKAERALGRQNARTGRCAAFYDGLSGKPE